MSKVNRTSEECDDCIKDLIDPAICEGHPLGPASCREYLSVKEALEKQIKIVAKIKTQDVEIARLKAENERLKTEIALLRMNLKPIEVDLTEMLAEIDKKSEK